MSVVSREVPGCTRTLQLACLLLLGMLTGCAGATDRSATSTSYDQLVRALSQGESQAWQELPGAFLTSAHDIGARLEHLELLHSESANTPQSEYDKQDELTRDILDTYYGDLRAHELRHRIALAQGDREQAGFHRSAYRSLSRAIDASGDGTSTAPWKVISSAEAHAWLISERRSRAGAVYDTGADQQQLQLVFQSRRSNGDSLETLRFDLTPTLHAINTHRDGPLLTPTQFIRERASLGDLAAQTSYAIKIWQRGDADRVTQAVQWLQDASEAGNVIAQEKLGTIYAAFSQGRAAQQAERLIEAAIDQFLLAAEQGSTSALYNLGQLYLSGHFGDENQPGGIRLLEQASDRGNLDATVLLARLYYNGQFVHRNRGFAIELLEQAAVQGHRDARLLYVRHHLSEPDAGPLDEQAFGWLQQLANDDNGTEAMLLLGSLLARGDHVERDPEAAVNWFKRAAAGTDNADTINTIAWILTVAEQHDLRDPEHGLQLMNHLMQRDEMAKRNAAYLDTWAAAHAATGNFERAIELQEQAVAIAEAEHADREDGGPEYLPQLQQHLEKFRRGDTVSEDVP